LREGPEKAGEEIKNYKGKKTEKRRGKAKVVLVGGGFSNRI